MNTQNSRNRALASFYNSEKVNQVGSNKPKMNESQEDSYNYRPKSNTRNNNINGNA